MARLRFPEQVATNGNDFIRSGSNQVTYALRGDDILNAEYSSDNNYLVGGTGNDTYVASNNSAITILDTGGHDRVVANGIGLYNPETYAAIVDDRHLLAVDLYSGQQVAITDWQSDSGRIEEFELADGVYTVAQIQGAVADSPNFLGNVTTAQLVEEGFLPTGTTTADLSEFIDYVRLSEADLATNVTGLDDSYYLAHNPDVAAAGIDPDVHYAQSGQFEGRAPNAWFDTGFYLSKNPDVATAGVIPVEHYFSSGASEGRDPNAWFDTDFYLNENRDVAAAGVNPAKHFVESGRLEGRDPNDWFDTDWYLSQNPDVAAAGVNPVAHYWSSGWREGRDPSTEFDTGAYLEANQDVALVGINPLEHWMQYGEAEGRLMGV